MDKPPSKTGVQQSADAVEVTTRWGLVGLSALAAAGALLRVFAPGPQNLVDRLDQTTLVYLGAAGGLLLLRQVKTFSLGQLKLEMLEKLRERQQKQEDRLGDIAMVLPLLLADKELRHILNLFFSQTSKYDGNSEVRQELRRLRSIGLIATKPSRHIGHIRDGMTIDLSDYVELTDLGCRWAKTVHDIQGADTKPPVGEAPGHDT